jgi:hypothetical protein
MLVVISCNIVFIKFKILSEHDHVLITCVPRDLRLARISVVGEYIFILPDVAKQVCINEYHSLKTMDQNQVVRRDIYDTNLFE